MFFLLLLNLLYCADVDDTYNKIMTDKFFRGIVADNIIEQKKYYDLIDGNFSSYASLKEQLILWIEKNPKKAAELFNNIVNETGYYTVLNIIYEYKINPKFKEFIDKMESAGKDNSLSDEKRRVFSSFIFDANSDNNDSIAIDFDSLKSDKKSIIYNYMNVNIPKLLSEVKAIDGVNSYLSQYRVDDLNNIISIADLKYKKFSEFIASIKGLAKITENQSKMLLQQIADVKKFLLLKFIVIKYRNLNKIIDLADEKRFVDFSSSMENKISKLSKEYFDLKYFNKIFLEYYSSIEEVEKEAIFIANLKEIRTKVAKRYFSCLYDFIVHIIHLYIYPVKNYLKLANDIKESSNKIDEFLKKYKTSYDSITDNDINEVEKYISIAKDCIKKIDDIKSTNRKIQYLFFDNIIPYEINYDFKQLTFEMKLANIYKKS